MATDAPITTRGELITNEDSRNFEFDDTNLFAINRFPGRDRYEGGPRVNYGLRGAIYGKVALVQHCQSAIHLSPQALLSGPQALLAGSGVAIRIMAEVATHASSAAIQRRIFMVKPPARKGIVGVCSE